MNSEVPRGKGKAAGLIGHCRVCPGQQVSWLRSEWSRQDSREDGQFQSSDRVRSRVTSSSGPVFNPVLGTTPLGRLSDPLEGGGLVTWAQPCCHCLALWALVSSHWETGQGQGLSGRGDEGGCRIDNCSEAVARLETHVPESGAEAQRRGSCKGPSLGTEGSLRQ